MSYLKTTFITRNSIGKINKITKEMFNRGINIKKSQMVTHRNLLIFNTEYENPYKNDISDIVSKYNFTDLKHIFQSYTPQKNYFYKKLEIRCADSPGIIHHTSDVISNLNINIQDLESYSELSPISNTDVFHLKITLNIPDELDVSELEENMENIVDMYGVEYKFNQSPKY